MKKVIIATITVMLIISAAFGGGIVTNTNQSAEFMRTLNRNASTDVDAAYFNPAGLTKLEDGFHIYLSNQTILQTREIKANYPKYNNDTFEGETFAPIFPNLYFVYKSGKLALSTGIMPIGGGGSAKFPKGLPSFDYILAKSVGFPASLVNEALDPYGNITGYALDASFTGSSIYLGGQVGASYAINDMLSVAAGFRFISANNTYEGSLKNVTLKTDGSLGDITGIVPDIKVDVKRTGSAFTGIVGLNIAPIEGLNLGFRYEHLAKLVMENDTKEDGTKGIIDSTGMFPDGAKINADMPSMIAVGAAYKVMPKLKVEVDFCYYMNTGVNWDWDKPETSKEEKAEDFIKNGTEIGVAIEYSVSDALSASIGYLISTSGAKDEYQSDMDYSLNTSSIALGAKYALSSSMSLSVGFSNTFYKEGQNAALIPVFEEKYMKTAIVGAIGLEYSF